MTSTPDTLSPEINLIIASPTSWGLLLPFKRCLRSYDLVKKTFSFGRAKDCDCSIAGMADFITVSNRHFLITKDQEGGCYIQDTSKYGTYINKNKIAQGINVELFHDDEISVGTSNNTAFLYRDQTIDDDDKFLPKELQKTYKVSKELGAGSYGVVRLVYDKKSHRPYAAKIIKGHTTSNEEKILKMLNHPFIIRYKDSFQAPDCFCLITEYLSHGTLENQLEEISLTEKHVKYVFYQIAMAIDYLHRNRIIHRDIKPRNILRRNSSVDFVFKVADFGLSRILDEQSKASTTCGTTPYIAPEIMKGNKYNYKADIWSLGMLLRYMIFGRPLTGESDFIAQDCSSDIKELIRTMLISSPCDRIEMHEVMNHSWIVEDEDTRQKLSNLLIAESQYYEDFE